MELTILIPAMNEARNLSVLIPSLRLAFDKEKMSYEVLIIEGKSTDDTVAVAQALGCRVVTQSRPGYAEAISEGIKSARGTYLIAMDADCSHTPEAALQLFRNRFKADIVINSRYIDGGGTETHWSRDLLSKTLNFVYRHALGLPFREISGGFRIYKKSVLDSFESSSSFYEIQEELLIVPYWSGCTAIEIPYRYRSRGEGVSKAQIFRYGIHLILALKRFRAMKKVICRKTALSEASVCQKKIS